MEGPENGFTLHGRDGAPAQSRHAAPDGAATRGSGRARPERPRVRGRPREPRRGRRAVPADRRGGRAPRLGCRRALPGPSVDTAEAVRAYVRETAITYHHQVGTCKMGTDAAAVVDPRLRVHGIEGLRVADASVMPMVTTGNTNAPSIMIGERAAELPPRRCLSDLDGLARVDAGATPFEAASSATCATSCAARRCSASPPARRSEAERTRRCARGALDAERSASSRHARRSTPR